MGLGFLVDKYYKNKYDKKKPEQVDLVSNEQEANIKNSKPILKSNKKKSNTILGINMEE